MNAAELIHNFLTERLGVTAHQIQPHAVLADLGVDSLMLAELMFEAEDRFGIEIPSDLAPPRTVADMQSAIDALTPLKTA